MMIKAEVNKYKLEDILYEKIKNKNFSNFKASIGARYFLRSRGSNGPSQLSQVDKFGICSWNRFVGFTKEDFIRNVTGALCISFKV